MQGAHRRVCIGPLCPVGFVMARHASPKTVQCYHCRHRFEVSGRAQSTSCPNCNKALIVSDIEVKPGKIHGPSKEIKTCGKILIHKRGRMMAETIEAHGGIECYGIIDARQVVVGVGVELHPKSKFKGDLHSPRLIMEQGAQFGPSIVAVPEDPLGLNDLGQTQPSPPPPPPDTEKPETPKTSQASKASSKQDKASPKSGSNSKTKSEPKPQPKPKSEP